MILYYLKEVEECGCVFEKEKLYKKGLWKEYYLGTLVKGNKSCKVIVYYYSNGCAVVSTMPPFLDDKEQQDINDEMFEEMADELNAELFGDPFHGVITRMPTSTEVIRWICTFVTWIYIIGSVFMLGKSVERLLTDGLSM